MKIGFFGNEINGDMFSAESEYIRVKDIADAIGGKLEGAENVNVFGMCTDSREAQRGIMFTAIKGERTDGHAYISNTIMNGCDSFLCERVPEDAKPFLDRAAFIIVDDTVAAMGRLALWKGQEFGCKTVGITGSVGKTTTKEIIGCVLDEKYLTHRTEGNYNSNIGMPLVILETPRNTEINILEMGMGQKGDISYLSALARPYAAVITNIGHAHIETLGTRENIRDAKLEITDGLQKGGYLILNGDDSLLSDYENRDFSILRVSLYNKKCDFYARNIRLNFDSCVFDIVDNLKNQIAEDIVLNISGEHNVYAALFGYAMGSAVFGMDKKDIKNGIGKYRSVGMRQKTTDICGHILIEDCYNAGPESLCASLKNLFELSQKSERRSIAVIGDMLGLGKESERLHRLVGDAVARTSPAKLLLFGNDVSFLEDEAIKRGYKKTDVYRFGADEHLLCAEKLYEIMKTGDIILFKASRGMKAEKISETLKDLIKKTGEDADD